ncbi:trihelix transcription factor GTL1 isoform X2 [Rhodamnia argentea]|uniref:Trihelix transcription factor GTL1 isoform X2 n=1 Tax=Rhodamnia argentea TaxID=178133 RepID=A0A8B8R151_9MYRT|nr:trihelix transcription factor GTL1 isoform X2 [Rhodamnia argentea]
MQQGGGSHSHYGGPPPPPPPPPPPAEPHPHHHMVVEEASPISSRPPAPPGLDEIPPLAGGDMDALATAAAAADVGGSGGGGGGGGNRWPRQETLALLKIRSEMDAAFRDASLKGPLWEDVSRKLGELGYRRSAKKCKEKFENVHKYYKRTKEGRAGRQDGKTYKFFSELEALHSAAAAAVGMSPAPGGGGGAAAVAAAPGGLSVNPVSVGISFANPIPISSLRVQPPVLVPPPPHTHHIFAPTTAPGVSTGLVAPPPMLASPMGMIFSSNNSSSSGRSEEEDDDDEDDDEEGEPSTAGSSRKRKRGPGETSGSGGGSRPRMMELFEGLMKQVMQKQEEMHKRFLEAIEKREQDRMIREEAWRRQEMARLAQEHEIAAQERAASASRDAAIVSLLQKITGQTIHLPTMPATVTTGVPPPSSTPPPKPQVQPTHAAPHPQPRMPPPPTYQEQRRQQRQNIEVVTHPLPISTEIIMAVPEQQVPPQPQELILSGRSVREPLSSSRWPKVEVLELINLRSGLESRYQEAGPKGPLWEEISASMARMGYKRSAKRCKEKWENINKYFKKVKESNKKRPEDAKTCPYFHELDALYRRKVLGGGGGGETSSAAATSGSVGFRVELSPSSANLDARPVISQDQPPPAQAQPQTSEPEHKDGGGNSGAQERIAEEGNEGSLKKKTP